MPFQNIEFCVAPELLYQKKQIIAFLRSSVTEIIQISFELNDKQFKMIISVPFYNVGVIENKLLEIGHKIRFIRVYDVS